METITQIVGIKLSKEEALAIAEDLATCPEIGEVSNQLLEAMGVEYVVSEDDGEELVEETNESVEPNYVQ